MRWLFDGGDDGDEFRRGAPNMALVLMLHPLRKELVSDKMLESGLSSSYSLVVEESDLDDGTDSSSIAERWL